MIEELTLITSVANRDKTLCGIVLKKFGILLHHCLICMNLLSINCFFYWENAGNPYRSLNKRLHKKVRYVRNGALYAI